MRHEVIVGVERRRKWSDDRKLSILDEIGIGNASVADVAQRYDVSRQQLYQWRRQLRSKGLWPRSAETVFLGFDVEPEATDVSGLGGSTEVACGPTDMPGIEIGLANGRVLRCAAGVTDQDLMRLIRLVETA